MSYVELLAPAKNLEVGIAAINSGADAIYIGASDFGARKNAANTLEDIKSLVDYAHKFYVKVHVAINTILNDNELDAAIKMVKNLYNIGVDAIIIQDMGLLNAAIEKRIPPIQIHMSTQCDNRTLEKAKFFDNIGVTRIILARELSIEQISNICQATTCEIETFIHGALCVSYSGQCYLSYANGGRSANRGECAQPCRKRYSLIDSKGNILAKDKYLLSLKDFNASSYIKELIDAGVKSFKIEGRLKDISYVRNVVAYYNNLLNKYTKRTSSGKVFIDFVPDLDKTFNRGYTTYFLNSREQCFNFLSPKSRGERIGKVGTVYSNCFEIDSDISSQDGLCYISDGKMVGFLVNKVIGKKVYPNKMLKIKTGTIIYRNYNYKFEKQLSNSKAVRKIGITYLVKDCKIYVFDEDNNSVHINIPQGEQVNDLNKMKHNLINQLKKTGNSDFYTIEVCIKDKQIPFIPISRINELRRELLKMLMKERLTNYKLHPQKPICYNDFPYKNIDYKANIYNKKAVNFYEQCNCKDCKPALESVSKIPSGIELMRTKHCLKYAVNLCGKSTEKLFLVDKNKKYPLKFDCKRCEMVVYNP